MLCFLFFTQKTAYEMRISDWSSDVCSSDLGCRHLVASWCNRRSFRAKSRNVIRKTFLDFARNERMADCPDMEKATPGCGAASFRYRDRKSTRLNSSH